MNKIVRTAAVLLLALSPLSPAAFASDRHHGGDRHHDARPGHHGHGYRHDHRHAYRHDHRYRWHRKHHHGHRDVYYGQAYHSHDRGYRVVLPAPPLPVILPPRVVLKHPY